MNNTVRTVVIMIVASVWAVNFTAPIFVSNYKPSPELNVAFMAIIGVLTASYKMDKSSSNNEPPQSPPQSPPSPPIEPPANESSNNA
jgi:hypothetical protein